MKLYPYRTARVVGKNVTTIKGDEAQKIRQKYSKKLGDKMDNHIVVVDGNEAFFISDGFVNKGMISDVIEKEW